MSKKTANALKLLENGGCLRYRLERTWTGANKWTARFFDATGEIVKGFGFQTYYELKSLNLVSLWNSTSGELVYKFKS